LQAGPSGNSLAFAPMDAADVLDQFDFDALIESGDPSMGSMNWTMDFPMDGSLEGAIEG